MCDNAWKGFKGETWKSEINVADFIKENYTEYTGDDSFLTGISKKSKNVWDVCCDLFIEENKNVFKVKNSTITEAYKEYEKTFNEQARSVLMNMWG